MTLTTRSLMGTLTCQEICGRFCGVPLTKLWKTYCCNGRICCGIIWPPAICCILAAMAAVVEEEKPAWRTYRLVRRGLVTVPRKAVRSDTCEGCIARDSPCYPQSTVVQIMDNKFCLVPKAKRPKVRRLQRKAWRIHGKVGLARRATNLGSSRYRGGGRKRKLLSRGYRSHVLGRVSRKSKPALSLSSSRVRCRTRGVV